MDGQKRSKVASCHEDEFTQPSILPMSVCHFVAAAAEVETRETDIGEEGFSDRLYQNNENDFKATQS